MSRASKVMVMVVVVALGVWGCARKPANRGQAERVKALEGRCVQLEQDYRTVAGARDQARKQAQSREEENARLRKEVAQKNALVKERDELLRRVKAGQGEREQLKRQLTLTAGEREELRQQLGARTHERDTLQGRCERLRTGLQTLLTQDESPFPPQAPPVTTAPTDASVGG